MSDTSENATAGEPVRFPKKTKHAPRKPVAELEQLAVADPAFVAKYHSRVRQTAGCWEWRGSQRRGSVPHGIMSFRDHTLYAHRLAFLLRNGSIPPGAFICHTCDNGLCQNPDHLYAGNAQSNAADMVQRGRARQGPPRRGMANNKAWLSDEQVSVIRRMRASGVPQRKVAAIFGCSQSTVCRLEHGKTRHVSPREDHPSANQSAD